MTQSSPEQRFESITQPVAGEFDVRRMQLEEAARSRRVQAIIHEWQTTQHYDSLEACDALGPFGLDPWDIDVIIPLYLASPEVFHGEA